MDEAMNWIDSSSRRHVRHRFNDRPSDTEAARNYQTLGERIRGEYIHLLSTAYAFEDVGAYCTTFVKFLEGV